MMLSKRSIERRNERINGRRNGESLDFMKYVKHAPTPELEAKAADILLIDWKFVAIVRELGRRKDRQS